MTPGFAPSKAGEQHCSQQCHPITMGRCSRAGGQMDCALHGLLAQVPIACYDFLEYRR